MCDEFVDLLLERTFSLDLDDETAAVHARSAAKALDSPSDFQGGPVQLPCVCISKQ